MSDAKRTEHAGARALGAAGDGGLGRLARRIADGEVVDWSAEHTATGLGAHELDAFRALAAMCASIDRTLPPDAVPIRSTGRTDPLITGFDVVRELGRGAFGQVFLARDKALDREVALKVLRDDQFAGAEARSRFLREARILAKLEHENIVRIHSVDEQEGRLRLSLERIDGETLDHVVRRRGPLPPREAARIALDLCGALDEIHRAGLVHGDLKPSNVMLSKSGRTVLLDFGIARDPSAETRAGIVAPPQGTPLFMAPEVFDGLTPDPRADLFALGAVLFFLLTGRHPFPGADLPSIRCLMGDERQYADLGTAMAGAPSKARAIVLRCLSEDRDDRPENAAAVARQLESYLGARIRRRRLGVALAIAAAVVFVVYRASIRAPVGVVSADLLLLRGTTEQRIADGDVVEEGDRIVLDLETDRPLHLYVFNEDDHGVVSCLYPADDANSGRSIAPGGSGAELESGARRLPSSREGRDHEWIMGKGGAAEFFLVVASDEPSAVAEGFARAAVSPPVWNEQVAEVGDVRSVGRTSARAAGERAEAPPFDRTRLAMLAAEIEAAPSAGKGPFLRSWSLNRREP